MFALVFALIVPLITLANVSRDVDQGSQVDWRMVLLAVAILAGAMLLVEACRRWFNFMLNSDECTWKKRR